MNLAKQCGDMYVQRSHMLKMANGNGDKHSNSETDVTAIASSILLIFCLKTKKISTKKRWWMLSIKKKSFFFSVLYRHLKRKFFSKFDN
jgi:hypothetical protein